MGCSWSHTAEFDGPPSPGSVFSIDSYIEKLTDEDKELIEMMNERKMPGSNVSIAQARKEQSHIGKKLDHNDIANRPGFDEITNKDYLEYKAYVDKITEAKDKTEAAKLQWDKCKSLENRLKHAEAEKKKIEAAIAAGTYRLNFMIIHPGIFNTRAHKGHLKQVEANLNSAKLAWRNHNRLVEKIHEDWAREHGNLGELRKHQTDSERKPVEAAKNSRR